MDVLDEVPAGGRLTRSLRKRLTSVDSEASSSRPSTPINTKLNSINEQNSPPRSTRMTRRNSVTNLSGTPAKTPSKTVSGRTVASKSEVNSPMRRSNRRRSISITEDEETTGATPLKSLPKIEVVAEEEVSTSKRVTRSVSKSPQQSTNGKNVDKSSPQLAVSGKRSTRTVSGPKSKTKARNSTEHKAEIDSEVEVIDLDTDDEYKGNNAGNAKLKNSDSEKPIEPIQTEKKTPQRESQKSVTENQKIIEKNQINVELNDSPTKSAHTTQKSILENKKMKTMKVRIEKMEKSPKLHNTSISEISPKLHNTSKSELSPKSMNKLETVPVTEAEEKNQSVYETQFNQTENEVEKNVDLKNSIKSETTSIKSSSVDNVNDQDNVENIAAEFIQPISSKEKRNNSVIVTEVIDLQCISPEAINHIIGKCYRNENLEVKNKHIPEKLKSVGFNDSIEEDASKNSYPKTPCLRKSKSYIELDSSTEADKDNSFEALKDAVVIEEEKHEEQTDAIQTPIKVIAKLKTVQSSTPLLNSSTVSSGKDVAAIEEELINLDDVKVSPLNSPKKAYSLRRTSLAATTLSTSPANEDPKMSPSKICRANTSADDDEMKKIPSDRIETSKFKQRTPVKHIVSPIISEAEIPKNSTSPKKFLSSCETNFINESESMEPLVVKDVEEKETSSNLFKEHDQLPKKSPRSLEASRKKSLDSSLHSPTKMMLRNSPKNVKSPKIVISMEANDPLKSPKEFTTSIKATEAIEKETMQTNIGQASGTATEFPTSWSVAVSGTSNNSKIDKILAEKEKSPKGETENSNDTKEESSKPRRHSYINMGDDDEDDNATDEDEDEELADNEKSYKKHDFILGEAMEVDDDYQSGDSMDSDEREELENNKIPCDGESIGSEDTNDDDDEDEDENDSFIADDSNEESLLDYSDDEEETEHLLEVERKNKKNLKKQTYRRILRVDDDDEDEDDDDDEDEDDDDDEDDDNGSDVNKDGHDDVIKQSSSEEEEIGYLINNIGDIINEDENFENSDNDDGIDVANNVVETLQVSKPKDSNADRQDIQQPSENHNHIGNLKGKRQSLTRSIALEERVNQEQIDDNVEGRKNEVKSHEDDHEDQIDEVLNQQNENHRHDDGHVAQKQKDKEHKEDSLYKEKDQKEKERKENDQKEKDQDEKDQEDSDHDDNDHDIDDSEENDEKVSNLNCSKLSETALRLHVSDTDDEENSGDSSNHNDKKKKASTKNSNTSRKKIMKHMQKYDRFNKTVHDFRLDRSEIVESGSTTPEQKIIATKATTKLKRRAVSLGSKMEKKRLSSNRYHKLKENGAFAAVTETDSSSSEDESHHSTKIHMQKRYSQDRKQGTVDKNRMESSNNNDKTHDEINEEEEEEIMETNANAYSSSDSEANISEKHQKLIESKTKQKMRKSSAALSVSLGYVKENHGDETAPKNVHSSFTIGVVVRNDSKKRGATPEPHLSSESSLNDDNSREVENIFKVNSGDVPSSDNENVAAEFSSAEEEQLQKLLHQEDAPHSAGLNSSAVYTMQSTESITDFKNSSKQRRTISIPADYGDFTTSQSFIESVAADKRGGEFVTSQSSTKRKRLSKSFCAGASLDMSVMDEVHHLNKKSKLACYDNAVNSSTPRAEEKETSMENDDTEKKYTEENKVKENNVDEEKKTINNDMKQRVLNRCEEILEAANRAKLEAKINSNKNKVNLLKKKKSKKSTRVQELQQQHENTKKIQDDNKLDEKETQIISKELKRQEKAKLEIEKALKGSANLILNKTEKKIFKDMVTQQLPTAVLDKLCTAEPTSSSKENSPKQKLTSKEGKKIHKTSAGDVLEMCLDEKKKNTVLIEEIQLSTGTVRVEPVTPTKHLIRSGFRESPMTPLSLGYKVRNILSAGQDTPPVMPVKERKRKRNIEEPTHTLPKPQWTKSGVFIEEEIYASAPITSSGSTKFTVSALNGVRQKKKKLSNFVGDGANRSQGMSTVSSSALQFKNNALFRSDIQRESSRDLIHRKQRKNI